MSALEGFLCFRGQVIGLVEYLELQLALPTDCCVAIRIDIADREQGGEQRDDRDSLHRLLFYAIRMLTCIVKRAMTSRCGHRQFLAPGLPFSHPAMLDSDVFHTF